MGFSVAIWFQRKKRLFLVRCLTFVGTRTQTSHTFSRLTYTLLGFEEIDGEDDFREEFACPFCSDYFDIVSLCCHIDEKHPTEARNAVCPVCAVRVGVDMVAHITLQHANMFKMQRKRKSRRGGSNSTLSILKREFPEGNLQSLFGGSSCILSSSANSVADPLLSSFISPMADEFFTSESRLTSETDPVKKPSDENSRESVSGQPTVFYKQVLMSDRYGSKDYIFLDQYTRLW
ncbi:PREDICTED: protein DEHYDRATION-INDUCED 19 homolog 3-like isoform X2 [Tarenaya hassleriana]|uniref:protein DEHYDRATION-INDUCED 19 homolog 3-like isoform X2 n=1 Tax=Tarenaya hassleriana TaxID=28532 RepID=UPI00053C1FFD|nr:PREDICTED: protein DEHYDRATION-INDUCED 19 homolog 3-like isoform X2 [Tarenaya hassleriana]